MKCDLLLCSQCLETLQPSSLPDAAELADLLTRYEFEGLLYAHDAIATQDVAIMAAGTPSCEDDSSEHFGGEENIKIIKIEKTNEPLVCHIVFFLVLFSVIFNFYQL
jgi:hypothetical protein